MDGAQGQATLTRQMLANRDLSSEAEVPRAARHVLYAALRRLPSRTPDAPAQPQKSEYIVRGLVARPAHCSSAGGVGTQPTAQRMYVAFSAEHMRLAIALSVDLES